MEKHTNINRKCGENTQTLPDSWKNTQTLTENVEKNTQTLTENVEKNTQTLNNKMEIHTVTEKLEKHTEKLETHTH